MSVSLWVRKAHWFLVVLLATGAASCSPPPQKSYPAPLDAVLAYYANELVSEGRQKWRLFIDIRDQGDHTMPFTPREIFGIRCLPAEKRLGFPSMSRVPQPYEQSVLLTVQPVQSDVPSRLVFKISKLYGPNSGVAQRVVLERDALGWKVCEVIDTAVF